VSRAPGRWNAPPRRVASSPVFPFGEAVGIQRQPLLFDEAAFDAGDIPAQAAKLRPRPSGKDHGNQDVLSLF
jgi:hypothetical protein